MVNAAVVSGAAAVVGFIVGASVSGTFSRVVAVVVVVVVLEVVEDVVVVMCVVLSGGGRLGRVVTGSGGGSISDSGASSVTNIYCYIVSEVIMKDCNLTLFMFYFLLFIPYKTKCVLYHMTSGA